MRHLGSWLSAAVIVFCSLNASAETSVVHAGALLAVPGERPASEQTVVIVDGRITEVRRGFADAAEFGDDVEVINLRDHFVLPGLMDMHVHLQGQLGPNRDSDRLKMSAQMMQMQMMPLH